MSVWYSTARSMSWPGRAVFIAAALALLLVTAIPVAFLAGVVLVMLGHVLDGLAVFGGSLLAAGAAVVVAGLSGIRHVRKLISRQRDRIVQLGRGEYTFD